MPATAPTSGNTATTSAAPTAQANNALAANANIPAGQAGSPWTAAPGTGTGVPNPTPASTSTTVQSNANVIQNKAPAIQTTTNNLANSSGLSTNSNGQVVAANGTLYNPSQPVSQNNLPSGESYVNGQLTYTGTNGTGTNNNISPQGTLISGGYIGDTFYAPGTLAANVPTDANGQPQQLSSMGTTDQQIMTNLQTAKAQADSLTASLIDSIQSQYSSLIANQQQANASELATTGHSLIKEGTSQLDPIGAAQITQAQVSYGLSQISNLQSKEQSAIIAAQQAGQDEDFKLMDDMNTEAQSVRTQQQDAASKILDAVTALNAQQAATALQQKQDLAIGNLYNQGVTDPTQIINTLTAAGMTVDATQVANAISALNPDQKEIDTIATAAAQAGASPDVISQITNSKTAAAAITAATPALGAKWASDQTQQKFEDNLQLKQLAVSQENAATSQASLQEKLAADGLTMTTNSQGQTVITAAAPGVGTAGQEELGQVVTTPSKNVYVDATNLSPAAKAIAAASGLPVLTGAQATGMNGIINVQGQVSSLLAALQNVGMIDGQGKWTGKTPDVALEGLSNTPATNKNNYINSFNTGIKNMITDIQKSPDTGSIVAALDGNTLGVNDSPQVLQQKITAITSALNNSETSLLAGGISPQQVSINGQTLYLQPDGQYSLTQP